MRLLSVGDLNLDIIFYVDGLPREGGEALAPRMEYSPGGAAANLAVAFSRLGGEAWFMGSVGRDFIGEWLRGRLREEGVRDDLVASRCDFASGTMCIVSTPRDRTIIGHRGANEKLPPPASLSGLGFDAVFISGYSFLGCNRDRSVEIASMYSRSGVPVYIDVSGVFAGEARSVLGGMGVRLRALLMNEMEAEAFFGGEPRAVEYAEEVVVKLGPWGAALYRRHGDPLEVEGFRVEVVDTTGAGDVFDAAYIWASLRGLDYRERLLFANAAAALKVTRRGGWGSPTLAEVQSFLRERGVEIRL